MELKMNYTLAGPTTTPLFRLGCNLLLRVINNEFVVFGASGLSEELQTNSVSYFCMTVCQKTRATEISNFLQLLKSIPKQLWNFNQWPSLWLVETGTVFPHMVSAETIPFLNFEILANSNSYRNISIFHLINWIVVAEIIQERKLLEGGNYMRKYGICKMSCTGLSVILL